MCSQWLGHRTGSLNYFYFHLCHSSERVGITIHWRELHLQPAQLKLPQENSDSEFGLKLHS